MALDPRYAGGGASPDAVAGVDVGCGASCVYALVCAARRGWRMLALERCESAARAAAEVVARNPPMARLIQVRHTLEADGAELPTVSGRDGDGTGDVHAGRGLPKALATARVPRGGILGGQALAPLVLLEAAAQAEPAAPPAPHVGIGPAPPPPPLPQPPLRAQEAGVGAGAGPPPPCCARFAFTMCNPPFFESEAQWQEGARRGFGGTAAEMVCAGGEAAFVATMARESAQLRERVGWFTSLLGRKATLTPMRDALWATPGVVAVRTTAFEQGRTHRWGIAWTFDQAIADELRARALRQAREGMDSGRGRGHGRMRGRDRGGGGKRRRKH